MSTGCGEAYARVASHAGHQSIILTHRKRYAVSQGVWGSHAPPLSPVGFADIPLKEGDSGALRGGV